MRAPLWSPQELESTIEHAAFLAWLMGGYEFARGRGGTPKSGPEREPVLTVRGDWAAALGVLGGSSQAVHALAAKWSWEVRGRAYWASMHSIGVEAARAQEESVLEFAALARELDRKWLELEILEVDKAIVQAKRLVPEPGQENELRFLPSHFLPRELIALRRAAGALEVQRYRAGILERAEAHESDTDFAKLPPADLEAYRLLRERARVGA